MTGNTNLYVSLALTGAFIMAFGILLGFCMAVWLTQKGFERQGWVIVRQDKIVALTKDGPEGG